MSLIWEYINFVGVGGLNVWLPVYLRIVISLGILHIWNEHNTQKSSRRAMQFSKVFAGWLDFGDCPDNLLITYTIISKQKFEAIHL